MTSACFSSGRLISPPSFAGSTETFATSLPAWSKTGISIMASSVSLPTAYCLLALRLPHPSRNRLPDVQQRPVRPGQRALDQQQVLFGLDSNHGMIPSRHAIRSHMTGHAQALLRLAAL